MGGALKTNPYLKMGVLTGIIRVIKAGIFSDLNNLSVYSILNEKYEVICQIVLIKKFRLTINIIKRIFFENKNLKKILFFV